MNEPLREIFARIRRRDAQLECPPAMEAKLLAALRQSRDQRQAQRPAGFRLPGWLSMPSWLAIPACAVAVLAAWLMPRAPKPSGPVAAVAPVAVVETMPQVAMTAPPPLPGPQVSVPVRRARRAASNAPSELRTEFFAIESAAPPVESRSGVLVRVQVPRAVMASFGLPVNEERLGQPVTADLLIGEDGTARAIRFVRPAWQ